MCSYFVSVRQPENCRTPLPPCLNFAKSTQMFQVILQSIFVRYLALQRRSTADASISHIPTPCGARKSDHLQYISYQIPTPRWRFLKSSIWVLMCNNLDIFINKNQYFLGFVEFRKKILSFRIRYSTRLKHRILIILSELMGWVFGAKKRYIIMGENVAFSKRQGPWNSH